MTDWEKEVERLDLNRGILRHDLDVMVSTCYNSFYCRQLELTIQCLEYNIAILRTHRPPVLKKVQHLLLPINESLY